MDLNQPVETLVSFGGPLSIIRAILGFILVFLLPGFAWTLVLFRRINVIERIALSFGLSIAVVALSIVALNFLFAVRITGTSALLTILVLTVVPAALYGFMRITGRTHEEPEED